jgi:versiconal hemiacetal acetate esterase
LSAGGGLALSVVDQIIKSGERSQIQGVVALVPVAAHLKSILLAYKSHYQSYSEISSGVPIIDAASMETFFKLQVWVLVTTRLL